MTKGSIASTTSMLGKTFKLIVTQTISARSSGVIFVSYYYRQTSYTPNAFSYINSWEIILTHKEIPTNRPGKKLQKSHH